MNINGVPLNPKTLYSVSTVGFLAMGGDGYTTFIQGTNMTYGPGDVNALVTYFGSLPQPVNVTVDGRVQRIT